MKLRWPSYVEIALQLLLASILALFASEYFQAVEASPCGVGHSPPGCYPQGMTEGPMEGGSWNYMNKEIYLKWMIVTCGVLAAAILAPFFTRGAWSGLAAIVLVLGFYSAEWLAGLL
jgi:hypothetical protein